MDYIGVKILANLTGRFRIQSDSGSDITPRGSKAQGLLALILTEPGLERSRAWLQDKLWSDRGQEQGAASLRQALAEIRRSFGDLADTLQTNRKTVSLDRDRVTVVPETHDEFLEGIDVRDGEFEHWLTIERSKRDNQATTLISDVHTAQISQPVLLFLDAPSHPRMRLITAIFIDYLVKTLRENLMITVHLQAKELIRPGALVITIDAFDAGDGMFTMSISLDDHMRRGMLWSAVRSNLDLSKDPAINIELIGLVLQISEALGDAVSGHNMNVTFDKDANLLANIAVRKLFTIDKSNLDAADRLLQQAYSIEPRGVFQAWRAQLLTIQYVERFDNDLKLLREKNEACCAQALAADSTNSNVLGAVANARMILDQDYVGGGELAVQGTRVNASNPLAWWSLSNAHVHFGNYEAAYTAAVRAQKLVEGTRLKFWGDSQRSYTAAFAGRPVEALRFCTSANALAPNFRPALRYLTVFNAAAGNFEQARENVRQLAKLEPGFSVEQLVHDKEYPVKFMHKTGLVDHVNLIELAYG
ncbi:MAG: hypothetical protein AAF950_18055 [Pseudomonadota bacterium]